MSRKETVWWSLLFVLVAVCTITQEPTPPAPVPQPVSFPAFDLFDERWDAEEVIDALPADVMFPSNGVAFRRVHIPPAMDCRTLTYDEIWAEADK